MAIIIRAIKFLIVAILSVFYWPANAAYLQFQKYHRKWKTEDSISYYLSMPLYYFFFLIVVILSVPLEMLGGKLHPPLDGFR